MIPNKNLRLCANKGKVRHGIDDSHTTRLKNGEKEKIGGKRARNEKWRMMSCQRWLRAGLGKTRVLGGRARTFLPFFMRKHGISKCKWILKAIGATNLGNV